MEIDGSNFREEEIEEDDARFVRSGPVTWIFSCLNIFFQTGISSTDLKIDRMDEFINI